MNPGRPCLRGSKAFRGIKRRVLYVDFILGRLRVSGWNCLPFCLHKGISDSLVVYLLGKIVMHAPTCMHVYCTTRLHESIFTNTIEGKQRRVCMRLFPLLSLFLLLFLYFPSPCYFSFSVFLLFFPYPLPLLLPFPSYFLFLLFCLFSLP